MRIGAVVLLALLEWVGSAWADVNGPNYGWWVWALRALAVVTLVVAFLRPPRLPAWVAFSAAAVALAAVLVTTQHFNDSYGGSRVWPDLLAVVFCVAVGVVALSAVSPRSPRASA
jgi:hypothetical protein